ncbi:MAG: UvrD-helicase domain-containing protein [Spirochaetales bacterium]|nr:UvrD-helicase domain-containing protein [Spirochaetales bacterium]
MNYIADLHVHSCHSRATSKASNLEGFYRWARVKGINLIGTGDFTHPVWFSELKEKLKPDSNGFFILKDPPDDLPENLPFNDAGCGNIDIRFCLSAEISSIYKKGDRTRKVHSVLFAPDFAVAEKINRKLDAIGNISSDGRPILGLDVKHLLEIVLDASEDAYLVPAHVWTPWFSLFGSKSGFDTIEECFEDLSGYIFALETGLSSDPEMNWRWSALDRYTLISNSDAHSPQKLGREANIFSTGLTYDAMFRALKTGEGFEGTIEFYPEEGKYHLDGHRKCGICCDPEETRRLSGECPVCGGKLTVGVMHRVLECADREKGIKPAASAGFRYCIPLPEIVSEITGTGPGSKGVLSTYAELVGFGGNEFTFLLDVPLPDIEQRFGPVYREAIGRMREGRIRPKPGFDGEFGVIRVFDADELEALLGQESLFEAGNLPERKKFSPRRSSGHKGIRKGEKGKSERSGEPESKDTLNREQREVLNTTEGALLITAGPGTGKTKTLTSWIARLIETGQASSGQVLAITFTNRASKELASRLSVMLGKSSGGIKVCTFHGFCLDIIRERFPRIRNIYDKYRRIELLCILNPDMKKKEVLRLADRMERLFMNPRESSDKRLRSLAQRYLDAVKAYGGFDLSSLITGTCACLQKDPELLQSLRMRYRFIAIDEFQDINPGQYELVSTLFPRYHETDDGLRRCLFAIGDPDQAIYGFRGSDVKLFFRLGREYSPVSITLINHYRSTEEILRSAASVIGKNGATGKKTLVPVRGRGEQVLIFRAGEPVEEGAFIASRIEELVGGMSFTSVDSAFAGKCEYSFSDIAVLTRTKAAGEALVPFLAGAGVPVSGGAARPVFSEKPFSCAGSLLHLLLNENDIVSLRDVLVHLYGVFSENEPLPFLDENAKQTEDRCLMRGLAESGLLTEKQQRKTDELLAFHGDLCKLLQEKGVPAVLECIFDTFPCFPVTDQTIVMKKDALLESAGRFQSDLEGFLTYCMIGPNESGCPFKTDTVRLLTFHASKGLEFPVVFVAGCEEGITPLTGPSSDPDEERRLFYVALTRAKDLLYLSWSKRRKVFGKWKENEQSRYLRDIPARLTSDAEGARKKTADEDYRQRLLFKDYTQ